MSEFSDNLPLIFLIQTLILNYLRYEKKYCFAYYGSI